MTLCALAGGVLAQIAPGRAVDAANRITPYVLGAVGLLLFASVMRCSMNLSTARERCQACCEAEGFPSMIYAPEYRYGPRLCTCSDRTDPESPRNDEQVCVHAGRDAGWDDG